MKVWWYLQQRQSETEHWFLPALAMILLINLMFLTISPDKPVDAKVGLSEPAEVTAVIG